MVEGSSSFGVEALCLTYKASTQVSTPVSRLQRPTCLCLKYSRVLSFFLPIRDPKFKSTIHTPFGTSARASIKIREDEKCGRTVTLI
jgi:hypothetical protein